MLSEGTPHVDVIASCRLSSRRDSSIHNSSKAMKSCLSLVVLIAVSPLGFSFSSVNRFDGRTRGNPLSLATETSSVNQDIERDLKILYKAAETTQEDPDEVLEALEDLEQKMRKKAKEDSSVAEQMERALDGSWRLVFTTGTKKTQDRLGGAKINYFPIKAVQSFATKQDPMGIENGIYVGEWPVLKFSGVMVFDRRKRKLEFDFTKLRLFDAFDITLKEGEAAQLGSASGLGSDSNVENAKRNKSAFFNWISADEKVATARGGGGGLALWKRVTD